MMTLYQLEVASKAYCTLLGFDPDELVSARAPFPAASGNIPIVLEPGEVLAPRWTYIFDKIRLTSAEIEAVQTGLSSPP
jgi:hypothetical protein